MDEKRDVIFTKSFDCIIDMDVKHGIKRVEIDCNVYMQHTKKSFPDVEELMIGPDVDEICIPNTLFPNVQMVYSDSIFFLAGRYLVKKRNGRLTLLNAFCKDEGLLLIHEGVFSGCKIDELRLPDSLENIGTFTDASGIKCIKSSHFIKDIPLNACRTGASSYSAFQYIKRIRSCNSFLCF